MLGQPVFSSHKEFLQVSLTIGKVKAHGLGVHYDEYM